MNSARAARSARRASRRPLCLARDLGRAPCFHTDCMLRCVLVHTTCMSKESRSCPAPRPTGGHRTLGERKVLDLPGGRSHRVLRGRERAPDRFRPRPAGEREPVAQGRRAPRARLPLHRSRPAARLPHAADARGSRPLAPGGGRAGGRRTGGAEARGRDARGQRHRRRDLPDARDHAPRAGRPAGAHVVRLQGPVPAGDVRLLQAGRPGPGRAQGADGAHALPLRPVAADRLRLAGQAADRPRCRGLLRPPGHDDPRRGART